MYRLYIKQINNATISYPNINKYVMLFIDKDEFGITTYMVCNNAGVCLIRTTSSRIANYVNYYAKTVDVNLRLTVGGDRGTEQYNTPISTHIRRFTK
jgi:hypothetical protein